MLNTGAFSSEQLRDVAVSPKYAQDKTIFVLTFVSSGGSFFNVWRTQDGALTWQKAFAASGSVQNCFLNGPTAFLRAL